MIRNNAGLTVMELAVVLSLTGLGFAVSIPTLTPFVRSNEVKGTAEQVGNHLRLARHMAIADGVSRIVSWDVNAKTYRIVRDDNQNGQIDSGETIVGLFDLSPHVNWVNPGSGGFSGTQVVFASNGSASQSGRVVFQTEEGKSAELSLLAPTGQVKVNS